MYFHPTILSEAQLRQRVAACDDLARACVATVERTHRLQVEVLDDLRRRQQEAVTAMFEAMERVGPLVQCSMLALRMPLQPLVVTAGEDAARRRQPVG